MCPVPIHSLLNVPVLSLTELDFLTTPFGKKKVHFCKDKHLILRPHVSYCHIIITVLCPGITNIFFVIDISILTLYLKLQLAPCNIQFHHHLMGHEMLLDGEHSHSHMRD